MKPSLCNFSHFLIIQTAFIGDTTLSLFVASAIKQLHPKCTISFVCTPICADLIAASADVDRVFPFDKRNSQKGIKGIKEFAEKLSNEHFDCIINLHASFRSSLLALLTTAQYRITFTQSTFSFLFSARIQRPKHGSERERQLYLLSLFSDVDVPQYSAIVLKNNPANPSIETFLLNNQIHNKPFAVIAPNSVWKEKRWGIASFKQLCDKLSKENIPIVVIGTKNERDYCSELLESQNVIDAVGLFTLPETVHLFQKARVVVSNDSAPIHFASVTNTPTIAMFGPTIPAFGFGPIAENSILLENKQLPCRPCSHNGSKPCSIGTHECMTSISVNEVAKEVQTFFTQI
jgi:heptosyltransferase-2